MRRGGRAARRRPGNGRRLNRHRHAHPHIACTSGKVYPRPDARNASAAATGDVPALSQRPRDVSSGSLRQRFERHRADPSCSVCHLRMDPIGFALENYDAIGRWRTKDGNFPIDTAGKLPDGTAINSADDVKHVLLAKKDLFVRNLVTKLLTY